MQDHAYTVYMITNKPKGVLYIGSTTRLKIRIGQHKRKVHPTAFSARFNLNKLVYFKHLPNKEGMLKKERQLKKWNRDWKIRLIEEMNPDWEDLYHKL